MTPSEFRKIVRSQLSISGCAKHGSGWVLQGVDVAWMYTLEIRHGSRFSLICGIDIHSLRGDQKPKDANACPMSFSAERLPAAVDRYEVRQAFSLDYDMADQAREQEVRRLLDAIVQYSEGRLTLDDVRSGFLAGELVSGFIHYRAREVLEARTA